MNSRKLWIAGYVIALVLLPHGWWDLIFGMCLVFELICEEYAP